jgi:hypothetical protein
MVSKVVRFEVFMAVIKKNGVFWDVTPKTMFRRKLAPPSSRVTRIG